MIREGKSLEEAAAALGVTEKYIRPYLRLADLDEQMTMIEKVNQGESLSKVAEDHGVTQRRVWQLVGSPAEDQRDPNYRTLRLRLRNETVAGLVERGQRMRLSGTEEDVIGQMLDRTFLKAK